MEPRTGMWAIAERKRWRGLGQPEREVSQQSFRGKLEASGRAGARESCAGGQSNARFGAVDCAVKKIQHPLLARSNRRSQRRRPAVRNQMSPASVMPLEVGNIGSQNRLLHRPGVLDARDTSRRTGNVMGRRRGQSPGSSSRAGRMAPLIGRLAAFGILERASHGSSAEGFPGASVALALRVAGRERR